jgi:hypothetical protein
MGGGPLENPNNNPVIETANRTAVYYGDWSPPPLTKLQNMLTGFMPAWLRSPVQDVLLQYGVKPGTFNPSPIAGGNVPSNITDSAIQRDIESKVAAGTLPQCNQFALFFPPGTTILGAVESCPNGYADTVNTSTSGYHSNTQNAKIPYAVMPFPCFLTQNNPHDLTEADLFNAMGEYGRILGHEDMEMRTGPLGNAWRAKWGNATSENEGADLCMADCDLSHVTMPYGDGKLDVPVQGFWSNADGGCRPVAGSTFSGKPQKSAANRTGSAPSKAQVLGTVAAVAGITAIVASKKSMGR